MCKATHAHLHMSMYAQISFFSFTPASSLSHAPSGRTPPPPPPLPPTKSSRNNGNQGVHKFRFNYGNTYHTVACEIDFQVLMGLLLLTFVYGVGIISSHFRVWTVQPVLSGQKFCKPMDIDFVVKALWKLAIFIYGRFEFDAVCDMKPTKSRKNARNQGNWLRPDNNCSRRICRCQHQQKQHFWRKFSAVYNPERLLRM